MVICRVLGLEMEDVHRKANILEHRIVTDHSCKDTVVVIKNVVWHMPGDAIDTFDHFLARSCELRVVTMREKVHTMTLKVALEP
jgi:hypothetical protein